MQDQDGASSSKSQEEAAASSAKEMDTAADQHEAVPSKRDLHRSAINSLNEVPKFSEEWFRLKETEISLRLDLAADLADKDDKASNMHADETKPEDIPKSAAEISLERMPSMNDAPIPVGAMRDGCANFDDELVAKKAAFAKPEQIDSLNSNTETARSPLETIERGWFDAPDCADESIVYPPLEEADIESELAEVNVRTAERAGDVEHAIHEAHPTQEFPDTPLIEAWAVDESSAGEKSVYMAEELIPWWKKRRTKLLLAVLVLVVVLAITLGLVIPSSVVVIMSQSPSMSLTPTFSPSNAPSSSPTECIELMRSSMQNIDLGGEVDNRYPMTVAVDGSNMVVLATGVFGDYNGTKVEFFSLTGDGVWERSTSIETGFFSYWDLSATLHDKTACVVIDSVFFGDQRIIVYEQNTIGEWEEVKDAIEFGDDLELNSVNSCHIDGDLACISDTWYDPILHAQIHILHRNGSKWIHFDTINGSACTIFGDKVAIDQEISTQENITTIQKHLFK